MDKLSCLTTGESRQRCIIGSVVVSVIVISVVFLSASLFADSQNEVPVKAKSSRDENLELKLVHVVSDNAILHRPFDLLDAIC